MADDALSTSLDDEIREFADTRDYWLLYLSEAILAGVPITDDVVDLAYTYFLEDAKLRPLVTSRSEILLTKIPPAATGFDADVKWTRLSGVAGVNALAKDQTLEIHENLTIVFGSNGAGKSGYVRLLKRFFYSKAPEEILPNVINENGDEDVRADFMFAIDGEARPRSVPEDEYENEFKQFSVFDGICAAKHLSDRNEFEFRPSALSFFEELVEAVERVEDRLRREIDQIDTTNTVSQFLPEGTATLREVQQVAPDTDLDRLAQLTQFGAGEEKQLSDLEQASARLATGLRNRVQEETKRTQTAGLIRKLIADASEINERLSKEVFDRAVAEIRGLKSNLDESVRCSLNSFRADDGTGIGSSEWKAFIIAATQLASKTHKHQYPAIGDRCLLCNRPFDAAEVSLIERYLEFVKSRAELEARRFARLLDGEQNFIKLLDFEVLSEDRAVSTYLTEVNHGLLVEIRNQLAAAKAVADSWLREIQDRSPQLTEPPDPITLERLEGILRALEAPLKDPDDDQARLRLIRNQMAELTAKKIVTEHFKTVADLVGNLAWKSAAERVSWGSVKKGLTDKDKELSTKFFGDEYISIFNDECAKLDGNFGIDVDTKGTKGRANRQLLLKGLDPFSVLSEGEQRVVAIADFLSESKMSDINKGIVFDDPVTSLDEQRKGRIAGRLVAEAKDRQVIVFTHDLVFTYALLSACADQGVQHACHWVEKQGADVGLIYLNNSPAYESKYKNAAVSRDFCDKAKTAEPTDREQLLKNGFAALRTSYESLVVFDLFAGVVQRFNERVSVDSLGSVTFNEDLRDEVLNGFALCCRFMEGHSHSDRYAYQKPEVANLTEEIERYETIRKKSKDRRKELEKRRSA